MTTALALYEEQASRAPGQCALSWESSSVTYGELVDAGETLASQFAQAGLEAGQRVALVASNQPWLAAAFFAAWRVGAVVVPVSARLREYDLGRLLRDAEPALVVSAQQYQAYDLQSLVARLSLQLPSVGACLFVDDRGTVGGAVSKPSASRRASCDGDIALILYTSGTTGEPKGALVRHGAVVAAAAALAGVLELTPDDIVVLVVPLTHAFGLICLAATLSAGGHGVLVDATRTLKPVVRAVDKWGATILHGSPSLFNMMAKAETPVPSLRTGFVAGAVCPGAVLEQMDATGVEILNLFGMTELGPVTSTRSGDPPEIRYATVGRPLCGYEVRIDDGADGELQVRGPWVTPGYYRRPEQTAAAFVDGWFRTGDLAEMDPDGNVRLLGRAKEVAHVLGFNVFPSEVQALLLTHPAVSQAAVVAVPDPVHGEALEAFVVPRPGLDLTPAALVRFARERVAGYKVPYRIRPVDELPLLATGKVDHGMLRAMAQGAE